MIFFVSFFRSIGVDRTRDTQAHEHLEVMKYRDMNSGVANAFLLH